MAADLIEAHAGSLRELREGGRLLTKVGDLPVVVFWHEDRPFAIEDRCPHMGFPLHRGTVEAGMVTCHWHHARFDLESGCTLDLWADDAQGFDVDVRGAEVWVVGRRGGDPVAVARQRLLAGLEEGLSLVIAKSVLELLERGVPGSEVVRTGVDFGARYRDSGWGAGLTVLVAMANVMPHLHPDDRGAALVHGLRFVSRDTRGHAPRFPVAALDTDELSPTRLASWYRRFIDTRSSDAAERVLATALAGDVDLAEIERAMTAAITDHVFVDGGHTLDFTNKAFEALEHVGVRSAGEILPTLVAQTARAQRSEELGEWRYPHDLVALLERSGAALADALAAESPRRGQFDDVSAVAWRLLDEDPEVVVASLVDAATAGATAAQIGQAVALAASLRVVRFHTRNDQGDWDSVHHAFTAANALHHSMQRAPSPELARGALQIAVRIYLDRFLNLPPARLPTAESGDLSELAACWEVQDAVDTAGNLAFGYLAGGGTRAELIAALGHALLDEDAEFHWYQVYEASVRQACTWPEGSTESALVLAGFARFLAAHTPTRRELPTVIRTAARLRRGEHLFEDDDA